MNTSGRKLHLSVSAQTPLAGELMLVTRSRRRIANAQTAETHHPINTLNPETFGRNFEAETIPASGATGRCDFQVLKPKTPKPTREP